MQSIGREPSSPNRTAICAAGGGATGILAVGYFKRLHELGIKHSMLFGTSAGALNTAFYAQGDLDVMEWIWMNVQNSWIKRLAPWNLFTSQASLYDSSPLRDLLVRYLKPDLIYARGIPVYITRTNALTFKCFHYRLDLPKESIDPVDVMVASCSIPGLFPPVQNVWYDGGLMDNVDIQTALDLKATRVISLQTSVPRPLNIRSILDVPEVVIGTMQDANYKRQLQSVDLVPAPKPRLDLLKPSAPLPIAMFDFDFRDIDRKRLIRRGYEIACRTLG